MPLILLMVLFSSCREREPIPEDKLVKIYADLVIARDTLKNVTVSEKDINKEVFRRYNVSEDDYKESIKQLSDDQEVWDKFFDKVIAHVEGLQKKDMPAVKKKD